MKKQIFMAAFISLLAASSSYGQKLIPQMNEEDGKFGFVDETGTLVVPYKYDYVADEWDLFVYDWNYDRSGGLVTVTIGDKIGFIDKTGKEVIPVMYEMNGEAGFYEGLAVVRLNNKVGIIDKTGKVIVPIKYDYIGDLSEGLAAVKLNEKWGFVDMNGKEIIPLKYSFVGGIFSEGLAAVRLDDKWGFVDMNGKEVIPCKYKVAYYFSEGLAIVELNNKYGFVDVSGKEVIPCKYNNAQDFSEGLAAVRLDGKWGFVDMNGKEVIPFNFKYSSGVGNFSEGLAAVKFDGKWGFVDMNGKEVIPCEYEDAYSFSEGLALVYRDGYGYGFIDKTGKEVTPFKYSVMYDNFGNMLVEPYLKDGLAKLVYEDVWCYIDKSGTEYRVKPAEVDMTVPVTGAKNDKTFAVIIANEEYTNAPKVLFAKNDGETFKKYCIQTLGLPENNVRYVTDASQNNMRSAINWLAQVADAFDGEANIIFYYAGHGISNETSQASYLFPVDGSIGNVTSGYKLSDLYRTLGEMPAKLITVFIDAPFNGAQRTGHMLSSARAVAIKAKQGEPIGNMVVFTAAHNEETASYYYEKSHGLFTYFLLKKLQETKGDVTLGELRDYITSNVRQQSIIVNNKSQTPVVTPSATIDDKWQVTKLK